MQKSKSFDIKLGAVHGVKFSTVRVGGMFSVKGWSDLYLRTCYKAGFNAVEYNGRHRTYIPADAKIKYYPKAKEG